MKRYILALSCPDGIGIVSQISSLLSKNQAFIEELSQYSDPKYKKFFIRLVFTKITPITVNWEKLFFPLGKLLHAQWSITDISYKPKTLILGSKTTHCVNDLLHQHHCGDLPIDIVGISSNHTTLQEISSWYEKDFFYLPVTETDKREKELLQLIEEKKVDLVILARYMQILSPFLTEKLYGKAINIHHSFLPSFKGAKPYFQAHDRGVKLIGATAHYITQDLDEGPIIEQEVERVDHSFSPSELTRVGRDVEARVLTQAVRYHIEKRVFINGKKTIVFRF